MLSILIRKELFVELRSREVIISTLAFGMAVLLVFAFSLSGDPQRMHQLAPGLFWILVLLSSSLGLHRLFSQEKEMDAFSSVIAAPVDRSLIFLAKWCSSFIFLFFSELIIIFPFFLFLGLDPPQNLLTGIGIILLGNMGVTAVGVIISGLTMRTRMSSVLLPVLFFPILTPLLIACTKATMGWYYGLPFNRWEFWVMILVTYIVIFALAGYTLFDHLTEE